MVRCFSQDGAGGGIIAGKVVRGGRRTWGFIQNLIFQYLQGGRNSELYDGQIRFYEHGRHRFGGERLARRTFR